MTLFMLSASYSPITKLPKTPQKISIIPNLCMFAEKEIETPKSPQILLLIPYEGRNPGKKFYLYRQMRHMYGPKKTEVRNDGMKKPGQ